MKVFFKKLRESAKMPEYANEFASGADLFSAKESFTLMPGARELVGTGLAIELPPGFEAQVRAKSGRALKEGLAIVNGLGTIDQDYRGEVSVLLLNTSHLPAKILKGQKIAQMVISPIRQASFVEKTGDLSATARGDGGFGSTGL